MSEELDERVSTAVETVPEQVTSMPIAVFEDAFITEMEAVLPRLVMNMPEGYKRGTHLDLAVEVRVRSVQMNEMRGGDMKRVHILAIEDVKVNRVFDPTAEPDTTVAGDAAAASVPIEDLPG